MPVDVVRVHERRVGDPVRDDDLLNRIRILPDDPVLDRAACRRRIPRQRDAVPQVRRCRKVLNKMDVVGQQHTDAFERAAVDRVVLDAPVAIEVDRRGVVVRLAAVQATGAGQQPVVLGIGQAELRIRCRRGGGASVGYVVAVV